LAHVFAASLILVCWVLALLGIRLAARISSVIGIISLVVIAVVMIGPLVAGHVSASSLSMHLPGWRGTGVWLYLAGSTLFASEIAAAFAPEYRDPKRDVPRALLSSAIFLMVVYTFTPFAAATVIGERAITQNPMTYGPMAAAHVFGGGSAIFTLALVASLIVSTLLFVNDAGRATAGMAEEGETIKQLAKLNRFGAPTWGTHVVIIVNIGVLLFVANPLGILLASNLGYILAHSLANWAFVILRKTQPHAPRPFKLKSPLWMPLAVILGLFHLFILYVGLSSPGLAGYGGSKETLIGVGILLSGLIFWVIRVVVQDHKPLRLRDRSAGDPGTVIPKVRLVRTSTTIRASADCSRNAPGRSGRR
jgi:amino acid transporter